MVVAAMVLLDLSIEGVDILGFGETSATNWRKRSPPQIFRLVSEPYRLLRQMLFYVHLTAPHCTGRVLSFVVVI
jgi:hypothetical protein